MKPFENCPVCGGELEIKEVKKLLRGRKHTAALRIKAEVCLRCGERLYSENTVRYFEQVRNKLKRQEVIGFHPVGQSFIVESGGPDKDLKADM